MLLAGLLFFAPLSAAAQNPYDAEQRDHAADAARQGRRPEGVLPLLSLYRGWDEATPVLTTEALDRLAADRRLSAPRRAMAGALHARALMHSGDFEGAERRIRELGYVTDWQVVGPFDNEGKRGFAQEQPPEAGRRAAQDLAASYPGRERRVSWRPYPAETSRLGYVNFDALFRPYENVCGFAETVVQSERAQPLTLFAGAGGAIKIYWNGEEVLADDRYRQPFPDRHVATVGAHAGANRLLVKVCVADATWGFFLRVGDADGGPATGVTVASGVLPVPPTGPSGARLPSRPVASDFEMLDRAAQGERASVSSLENLARFLAYTGADDRAERRARQLAARAADEQPTVERLVLAARLADERGEEMRFAAEAERRFAADPETLLLAARIAAGGPSPEDALPILNRVPDRGTPGMEAAKQKVAILAGLDLTELALTTIAQAAARAPDAAGWIARHAEIAEAAGRADLTIELHRRAVAARPDLAGARRALAVDALRRGEREEVVEQLDALARIAPDDTRTMMFAATLYEGLGMDDEANGAYVRALGLAPEDASVLAQHGRLLLRLGRADAAAAALREAMVLRPQDADTRELLEQIHPEERQDEAFAASTRELLARRSERSGFPTTVLQDLTVNTVFDNGLGSSFRQYAAQVHDQEGARQLRTYSIQYDPDSQRVDIRQARVYRGGRVLEATQSFEQQLGEPWYRIYYDTRALVVVFPDLEPGDVIELQYRIDDIAHRNLFADYYGDLHFLQGFSPVARMEYVLITPRAREFFFNEPRLRGLDHDRRVDGDQRIDRFVATDVPAIRSEPGMPGLTEIAPYLHVSTYRTWEDVGRWWWGLIQDQLRADESLREVVADLMRGANDLETKVQRIHNWVIRNTRYVGLEFGIHGFKPYRVPLIVQRGFGDCKDKASLMYTMFREAGIDARIVLVRTRRNGAIAERPASLAVFDHAIAYVPELDLYLDGTAEHSGTHELPGGDQGVTVLVVGPNEARLTQTPVLPPSGDRRVRELTARLEADGSGVIEVEETVHGASAPSYRSRYAPEGTREDRFERSLRNQFPGLVLESQRMEGLDELESDIEIEYRARVPQLGRRDGSRLQIAPSVVDDLVRNMAHTQQRRYPLDLGGTSSYVEERVVHVPRGYRATEVPEPGQAESEFGRLSMTVDADGNEIRTRTELEVRRDRISPDQYPAFRRWVERADAILRQQIGMSEAR